MVTRFRPRVVARIARWEVFRGTGTLDHRTVGVYLVGLVVLLAALPMAAGSGLALDEGIYRVGATGDSPYRDVVAADPTFVLEGDGMAAAADGRLTADEGYELVFADGEVLLATEDGEPTAKARAALSALRRSVEWYNDRRMAEEPNATAAFPVEVTLGYAERESDDPVMRPRSDQGGFGNGGAGDGSGAFDGDGSAGVGTRNGAGDRSTGGAGGGSAAPFGVDLFGTGTTSGSPSDIAPPFPFQSLVLAFAFLLPLNFVAQAYSSSVLRERINRRGELLLVAPVSPAEIVAGKTLPYLLGAVGLAAVVTALVGGGALSVLAVGSLALLFLAAAFLGGMLARSFKELTFVVVTVSVGLMTFAFVPAVFTDVDPLALISPLTLVVRDLTGTAVQPSEIAFAVLPSTLAAAVLFGIGLGIYREEDMFTQRPVHLKALDALGGRIRSPRSLVGLTAVLIPFVFVVELLAVAALFAVPGGLSVPLVLVVVAVVEEFAKSLPVLAGFLDGRYPRTRRTALLAGTASGLGFFVGEKLTLVVQLVGLSELRVGSAAFGVDAGVGGPLLAGALLLAPLALHVVTASISGLGAARGTRAWLAGTGLAVLVHVGYNLTVVRALV
ncbi:MAG: PrsW family intramembrane metalloprotease [Haloarculaceae archaeon]